MKNKLILSSVFALLLFSSCKDFLNEDPKSFLTPGNTLTSTYGFQTASNGLYLLARNELNTWSGTGNMSFTVATNEPFQLGTDICTQGKQINESSIRPFEDYSFDPGTGAIKNWWKFLYGFIANCNSIIVAAENPDVKWDTPNDKNHYIAEARFFRAHCYRYLTYIYGDVPWVEKIETSYRNDFTRTPVNVVLGKIVEDLQFAYQYLPDSPEKVKDGQVTKWVAAHVLAETYIRTKQYDLASQTADLVINSGHYSLMKNRFGKYTSEAGDPYADIFLENNANRSAGNKETLYVFQFQYKVPGGGDVNTNWMRRSWNPYYSNISGFVLCDSLGGRSIGQMATLPSWVNSYEGQDMRASVHNMQKDYYYNDPKSPNFGKKAQITQETIDMGTLFSSFKKFYFGVTAENANYSSTAKDYIVYRLSETYLIKAEADIMRNKLDEAAKAINEVRGRANATLIDASQATIDFLLDERARELIGEEKRRFTLLRTGKLLERTQAMNPRSKDKIKPHHILWPIPQEVRDANSGAEFPQNDGYAK